MELFTYFLGKSELYWVMNRFFYFLETHPVIWFLLFGVPVIILIVIISHLVAKKYYIGKSRKGENRKICYHRDVYVTDEDNVRLDLSFEVNFEGGEALIVAKIIDFLQLDESYLDPILEEIISVERGVMEAKSTEEDIYYGQGYTIKLKESDKKRIEERITGICTVRAKAYNNQAYQKYQIESHVHFRKQEEKQRRFSHKISCPLTWWLRAVK